MTATAATQKAVKLLDEASTEIRICQMYELSRWFPSQNRLQMYDRALERIDDVRCIVLTEAAK